MTLSSHSFRPLCFCKNSFRPLSVGIESSWNPISSGLRRSLSRDTEVLPSLLDPLLNRGSLPIPFSTHSGYLPLISLFSVEVPERVVPGLPSMLSPFYANRYCFLVELRGGPNSGCFESVSESITLSWVVTELFSVKGTTPELRI